MTTPEQTNENPQTQTHENKTVWSEQKTENEFQNWLHNIRARRERFSSLSENLRKDLERSRSWLEQIRE